MYKQLEIQQYLLLCYYTSSQFCKNYNTGILYIERNHYSFSHDFFFLFWNDDLSSMDLFDLTRLSSKILLSSLVTISTQSYNIKESRGTLCSLGVTSMNLGSNSQVNQADLIGLVVITAHQPLRCQNIKKNTICLGC